MNHSLDHRPPIQERLMSLDFFRGLTMFLLIGEATHIYALLVDPSLQGTIIGAVGQQFHHHPWNGLRFWDLVQPFFMFIVGVAMPFSFGKRWERGGREDRMSHRRNPWTRRSYSHRRDRWCRPRCAPCERGASWCARAFT